MNTFNKTKGELIKELNELQQKYDSLKEASDNYLFEYKQEEALRDSEEKFRLIAENTSDGILVIGVDTKIQYVSPAYHKQIGYSEQEELSKDSESIYEIIHPDDRDALFANIYEAIEAKKSEITYSYRVKHKNGNYIWREDKARFNYDENKNHINTYVVCRDITQRKHAEEKLKESEYNLRTLFNAMKDIVFEMDYDGRYIFIAPTSGDLLVKPSEEMIGKTLHEVFPKHEADFWLEFMRKCLDENKMNTIEYQMSINNKTVWFEGRAIPKTSKSVLYMATDITERKQAEEELNASEEKFRSITEQTSDLIALTDSDGMITYASSASKDMFLLPPEEMCGHNFIEFLDETDIPKAFEHFSKSIEHGERVRNLELKMKRKNNQLFIGELSGSNFRVGTQNGTIVNIRDITERKNVAEKIREKDIQFRKLSANLPDLIFQFTRRPDGSYCVPIASEGIRSIFGCSPEDVLDDFTPIGRVIHPDDADRVTNDIEYSAEHLTYFTCEFRVQIPGKEIQWIFSRSTPEKLPDGSITWYGFNADITERKQAEEALKHLSARLSLAVKAGGIGVWDYDIVNNTLLWDDQMYELYGVNKNDFGGVYEAWRSGVHPEDVTRTDVEIEMAMNGEKEFDTMFRVVWPDGSIHTIRALASVLRDNDGSSIRMIGTNWDISEQRISEQELIKAKEKAEESDRLKSAFLANMSHEIRTPMNGILGFSSLLKEPGLSGEEQQEYIQIIEQAGARMLNTINNIISISRIETGELSVSMSNTDINILMEDVYNFFNPQAEKKGLHFSVKASLSGKKAFIQTDREKVIAILFNLVKNAIKYTDNGSVEIGYNLKADSDPLELVFYVKDTGIGINENRQKAIFERFMQADIVDKDARQGSGLGLSISKAYIEVLGGKIGMESEKGHGSVFYFTLPYPTEIHEKKLTKNRGLEDVKEKQIDTRLSLLKILIAEDDENSEMYLRAIIKSLTKEILIAETGFEAVEACRDHPDIDLVLMDIQMPKMNGYKATREIRKFNKEIIIIAQTAFALAGDKEKAFEAGCNDYITKPVKKVELLKIIKKYFS